jgi:competence protein ComEC
VSPRAAHAARFCALGGLAAGLAVAPSAPALPGGSGGLAVLAGGALAGLVLLRPPAGQRIGAWLLALAAAGALAGLCVGTARLRAIDAGAFDGRPGAEVDARGFVTAAPRRANGEVRVQLDTADGRLMAVAPEPVPDLEVGHEVVASGVVREPGEWEAAYLARQGIRRMIEAGRITRTARRRGGLPYLTDRIRERAEAALGRGTPEPEASLLRGFVLGEDDRIEPATAQEFKRSGLTHLLAVSGQNVVLLTLLAAPLLALAGVPHRARLACLLALIAIYVPVAGAGPSIQRAGVMGAAGLVAALASRPASRWYATLLAAAATLALNPRSCGDVGWQLSFAAVAGIALWAARLRDWLAPERSGLRRAVAEGAAVTIAATLATAPLMAHHFEQLSVTSLPANLLAAPAVAPVMWLGMLAGAVGQLSWLPVEPLTASAGLCAAYIEQIAHWLGSPEWAQLEPPAPSVATVVAIYGLMLAGGWLLASRSRPRRTLRPRRGLVAGGLALALLAAALLLGPPRASPPSVPGEGLRVRVLDVGQGDAILLDPAPGEPVLVDTGPPEADVAGTLAASGVDDLAAVVVTHDESDHAGGLSAVLDRFPDATLAFGVRTPYLSRIALAAGGRARLATGSQLRSGALRVEALWPPRALLDDGTGGEPNSRAVVLLARWHDFDLLLCADAEAEEVPLDPGPIDVLKVAHHGSADAGLDALLDRTEPRVAVISVGADNPYGHPAPETLASLADHDVRTFRTDIAGEVDIDVGRAGWSVERDG